MTRQVMFTAKAETHLDSIHRYIRHRSGIARADTFVEAIVTFCASLDTFPHRGTQRDDILPGLRVIPFRRRVVLAVTIDANTVIVGGVYYGGRDFETDLATTPA